MQTGRAGYLRGLQPANDAAARVENVEARVLRGAR
jgi:hypothetical protein